jgi:hypothetical protein
MQDDVPRTIFNPEILKERVEKRLSATTDYIYSALIQIADLETEVDNDFMYKGRKYNSASNRSSDCRAIGSKNRPNN